MAKNRKAIQGSCPAGSSVAVVSKKAGEQWKALSEADRKPFEEEYQKLKAKYDEEMKVYNATKSENAGAEDSGEEAEETGSPQKTVASPAKPEAKKRGRPGAKDANAKTEEASKESPPKKKGRGTKSEKKDAGPEIDATVLAQASKLGMEGSLKNLALREDMKNIPSAKLLTALQNANGLVNKARLAIMEGGA